MFVLTSKFCKQLNNSHLFRSNNSQNHQIRTFFPTTTRITTATSKLKQQQQQQQRHQNQKQCLRFTKSLIPLHVYTNYRHSHSTPPHCNKIFADEYGAVYEEVKEVLQPRTVDNLPIRKKSNTEYPKLHNAKYVSQSVGIRSTRGMRAYNEDRYRIGYLSQEVHYLALFDGHGGSRSADFVAAHMHEELYDSFKDKDKKYGMTKKPLVKVIEEGVQSMSDKLDIAIKTSLGSEDEIICGTTCLVLLFAGNQLAVGSVGDCRAVLVNNDGAKILSAIHKPCIQTEYDRVVESGGEVIELGNIARVNGQLALSRALGDIAFRDFGVIPDCEVREYKISADDGFIIMATDGLWDTFTEEEAADIVRSCTNPCDAAQELLRECEVLGGEDNCTILILKLPGWDAQTGKPKSIPATRPRSRSRLF